MKSWRQALRDGARSGSLASIASTLALALRGKEETGSVFATTNVISRWVWGDGAARHHDADLRHTLVGYAIHHASSTLWAVLYEKCFDEGREKRTALAGAAAVAGLACFVDFKMTPYRLEPGFDKHLRWRSIYLGYAAFGAGLALRNLARRDA